MYRPRYKPNQLICGYGQTAIITGWTVKQSVAKHLDTDTYAGIGNLYSPTRGISPLIRNLLANPHIRFLVILQATKEDKNAGGCQCLLDFLKHGFTQGKSDTGRDAWVINSRITGYIDIEISADALEALRQSLDYKEAKSISEAVNYTKGFANQGHQEPWGESLVFPQLETIPTVLPGPRYGHRIEGETIAETWVKILHRIKTTGTIRPTNWDGKWQELIDLVAVVTDEPPEFYFPEPNYLPIDREYLKNYIPQILDDAPYLQGVKYTYGQRLRSWFGQDQIEDVINKLSKEIDSASAVMNLWDSGSGSPITTDYIDYRDNDRSCSYSQIERPGRFEGESDHDHSGSPCLNHIWVRVVDGELSLTATFRSNDMFSAWPANAMGLRALQQHIRDKIVKRSNHDLTMGPLITISQSAHIYDDCWESVDKLIANQYIKIAKNNRFDDPTGSFLISVKDNQIIVEHITPGSGEVVNCYSGKSAKNVYEQIANNCPSIEVKHAMYLGSELQKAEICLNHYQQDRAASPFPGNS